MKIALLIVFGLGVVAYVVFGLFRKERNGVPDPDNEKQKPSEATAKPYGVEAKPEEANSLSDDANCQPNSICGVSCFCDEQSLRRQMSEEIIYFEDEELDAFRGVAPDAYSQQQTDMFAEVLTTLRPQEVADWLHSLQLRGIALPDSLKEEAIMMME